ncbi:MAG: NAD(P)H-dependent oxidoreductase subunit E [Desulfobacteraceae bacterium]|nr:MAG: NAD(P)H-dependent oxidoreductase subunit E [Desulfobacteraceae bacterium]
MALETPIPEKDLQVLSAILADHGAQPSSVLQILLDINQHYHYLPQPSLEWVAAQVHMPINQIYSIATFFKVFSLTPRGRTIIHVCTGTACHVKGAPKLLDRMEKEINLKPGQTTEDLSLTLETVNCVGACASAPVVRIGEMTYSEVSPPQIVELLRTAIQPEG